MVLVLDLRLEVSDDVGDPLPQLSVDVAGEGVGNGSGDEDIGKGDPLADDEGSVKEDLVEDLKSGQDSLDGGSVGGLGVGDLVGEEVVGEDVSQEDLRQSAQQLRPRVRRHTSWSAKAIHCLTCARSLRSEGRMVWLGPSSVTNETISALPMLSRETEHGGLDDQIMRYHSRFLSTQVIKTGITEMYSRHKTLHRPPLPLYHSLAEQGKRVEGLVAKAQTHRTRR